MYPPLNIAISHNWSWRKSLPVRRKSASNFVSEHFSSEKTYPHSEREKKVSNAFYFSFPEIHKNKRFCPDKLILANDEIQYSCQIADTFWHSCIIGVTCAFHSKEINNVRTLPTGEYHYSEIQSWKARMRNGFFWVKHQSKYIYKYNNWRRRNFPHACVRTFTGQTRHFWHFDNKNK